jgi:thiamine biosynthesis lipoprotein
MPPDVARPKAFAAMGARVVVAGASGDELADVRARFAEWERVFSRFRPDSELSRVNGVAADTLVVSELFGRLLGLALDAAGATGGLVDPTLGRAIETAGYDRDFAEIAPDPTPPGDAVPGCWRAVRRSGRLVTRPAGTFLDLNGVVKAAAADEALELLSGQGFVSGGGDLATRGETTVALPEGGAVRVLDGGVATSGSTARRWTRGGEEQHHLIDPRTGRPSRSRWTQVTVAAGTAVAADVAAKAAFLLSAEGPDWLDARDLPGRFLAGSRSVVNRAWHDQIEPAPAPLGAAGCS